MISGPMKGITIMTDLSASENTASNERSIRDWADLAEEMWSYLTGKGAAINYQFVDMAVEVPRDTGPKAPRATWKIDGTLRISTDDDTTRGPAPEAA